MKDRNSTARVIVAEGYKDDYHICTHDPDGEETWRAPAEQVKTVDGGVIDRGAIKGLQEITE